MVDKRYKQSLIQLGILTHSLLTPKQRLGAVRNIFYSVILAGLEVLSLGVFIPLFYALTESGSTSSPYTKIVTIAQSMSWSSVLLFVIGLFIFKNIVSILLSYQQSQYIKKVSVSFSEELYHRFYQQSWTDYLQSNSAENIRKIKTGPSDFANYILQNYLLLFTDFSICLFMIVGMALIDFRVIIIAVLVCLPVAAIYYLFRKNILQKINLAFRDLTPKSSIVVTQGIDSFAESKIYQRENFFIDKFMEIREITAQHLANLTAATGLPARIFEVAGVLSFATVIGYCKTNHFDNHQLVVLLGLLTLVMYRIVPSINRMLISVSQIQAYSHAASELKEGFKVANEFTDDSQEIVFNSKIVVTDVSFQYPGSGYFQLANTNVSIAKGDFVVLEGHSGVGKTTFIHILAGLISEYDGLISVDKEVLNSRTLRSWQKRIGLVPQFAIVLQDTILRNVAFGRPDNEIDVGRVNTVLELTQLSELVKQLPFHEKTEIGENGLTLSGGQRQRLILARALYNDPEILLLDEVTNQLDDTTKELILLLLKSLSQSGKTIVVSSHDHAIRKFANRVLNFNNYTIQEVTNDFG